MKLFLRVLASAAFAFAPIAASAQLTVNAGEDVVLECSSADGAEYTLNGTVEGGTDVSVAWTTEPPVTLTGADTLTPTGTFPIGETIATLMATDVGGESASDDVSVTVEDTSAPVVHVKASPLVLWPPNHELRHVEIEIRTSDSCSGADGLDVELVSVESNEADNGRGDGNTTNDIQGASIGEDDRDLLLRAERSGGGDGRVYTITYRVTDASGNSTDAEAKVYVPHSYSKVKERLEDDMGGDAEAMGDICPRPDDAATQFVMATPQIGQYPTLRSCVRACRVWEKGCGGIVKGTSRCVYSEQKSRRILALVDCKDMDGSLRRSCKDQAKQDARRALAELRQQADAASATCERVGVRCENACADLHAPNGAAFDNEGVGEQ